MLHRHLAVPLLAGTALAQSLVTDVNATGANPSSNPTGGVRAGAYAYYVADDGVSGSELWRTDGTPAGTLRLRDIAPGAASSNPSQLTALGGWLYFVASAPATGAELWRTDGTPAGTALVADLEPGLAGSNPLGLCAFGGQLYFTATFGDAVTGLGRELWRTDGTAAGTALVRDVRPGPLSGLGSDVVMAPLGGRLLFAANDGANGRELWQTDGSTAGTTLLADLHPTASSNPQALVAAGSRVFFVANDGTAGAELWSTDGTAAGTALVADLAPGAAASQPQALTAVGAAVVFTADAGGGLGREPYASGGTAATTALLLDANAGAAGSGITQFVASGGHAYAIATGAAGQWLLLRSDGTPAGTAVAAQTYASLHDLAPVGGGVAFGAALDGSGDELWAVAGAGAPVRWADLNPGPAPGWPGAVVELPGVVCCAAARDGLGRELFACPVGGGAAALLADVAPQRTSASADPREPVLFQGRIWFSADDGVAGRELWYADASGGPAVRLDLRPGPAGSNPQRLCVAADLLFFTADDGVNGVELWASDGTPSGTAMVRDLNPGFDGSYAGNLVELNGQLLFTAIDSALFQPQLYVSDGTAGGTMRIFDFGSLGGAPGGPFVRSGSRAFFPAYLPGHGFELWVTDGSAAGTRMVETNPGPLNGWPQVVFERPMVAFGGGVVYVGESPTDGYELWFSDGTAAGTAQIASVYPGNSSGANGWLTSSGGFVYFQGYDPAFSLSLWRTDGTAAGTVRVPNLGYLSQPTNLCDLGGALVFESQDNLNGRELWRTDGTAAGTFRLTDLQPGQLGGVFGPVVRVGATGVAVFGAGPVAGDRELWRTDGTVAGTWLAAALNPSATAGSQPDSFALDGAALFCVADDGQLGREPWRVPVEVVGAAGVEQVGVACPGSGGLRPRARAAGLPQLGNAGFAIQVTQAAPLTAAFLLLDLGAPVALPLGGGCTAYVPPSAITLFQPTSPAGAASHPLGIPNTPALSGLPLAGQWWILDANGAYQGLASVSDGLRLVVGQ